MVSRMKLSSGWIGLGGRPGISAQSTARRRLPQPGEFSNRLCLVDAGWFKGLAFAATFLAPGRSPLSPAMDAGAVILAGCSPREDTLGRMHILGDNPDARPGEGP